MPHSDTPLSQLARWYGTAAAGALTLGAVDAEAQVTYTDADPDILVMDTFAATGSGAIEGPSIDFDGDGDAEILIGEANNGVYTIGLLNNDSDGPDVGTGFIGNTVAGYGYFLALSSGVSVGPANPDLLTNDGAPSFTFNAGDPNGFQGAGDVFIGVQFQIDTGTTHYGWVRVNMPAGGGSITVLDWAFEATPDTPITTGDVGVAVEPGALPDGYVFSPIGPNPIRSSARFTLRVAETETVKVAVYDMLGREVSSIYEGELPGGVTRPMELRAGDLPAGTYVVRVTGDTFDTVRRVTVAQ